MNKYAELFCASNFSFLRGASHPEELVLEAKALGLHALAITDWMSVSGLPRAHRAAQDHGLRLVIGTRLVLDDGPDLLCYPEDRAAYGRLTRLLTLAKRRTEKGSWHLTLEDVLSDDLFKAAEGQVLTLLPPDDFSPRHPAPAFETALTQIKRQAVGPVYLNASPQFDGLDKARFDALARLAEKHNTPLIAGNDVHMHNAARRRLQDVVTCIRGGVTLESAGSRLFPHGERHLKSPDALAKLFKGHEAALTRTLEIVERCRFSLSELSYDYPTLPTPDGRSPQAELERLTWAGADERYPCGIPDRVRAQVSHELKLIGDLGFAPYFLTVEDLVRFARGRGILCQGRGSAANSAVCYCLKITAVDPARLDLLFERFVSAERGEPPDIDVDFENARREEVIQYVYDRYGRARAGMTAAVITYRAKGAVREIGKVFGLTEDTIIALQGAAWRWRGDDLPEDRLVEQGLDGQDPLIATVIALTQDLMGFPRHLSQHSGGMVMTATRLDEVVPIANAAMADRTMIEWDKNDLDALGILKIDILALGMLTAVQKAFHLIRTHHGRDLDLATVPTEDPATYDMLCDADSVGVFQVESRAQMSMLPRLKPRCFYDLVIEVAIVRPGPIQGDMVHPYLRRREGLEDVTFPSDELCQVLGKTLGVPLFQEQAMKIAIVAAGFTATEADQLRRAMATFKMNGDVAKFHTKFVAGMIKRGYEASFAERCFRQIEGFADYGFPESHSASFALIVYVSAWLKRHYPEAFTCALLNSQPMGFYAPAQLIRDARAHAVEVRPIDVNFSTWDCTLEPGRGPRPALRLGFRQVKGLREVDMDRLVAARGNGYGDLTALVRRAELNKSTLDKLAQADAFGSIDLTRRPALWQAAGLETAPGPLFDTAEPAAEPDASLPEMSLGEEVAEDYRAFRLSLKAHPLEVLRPDLTTSGFEQTALLQNLKHGARTRVAGIVTARQRPGTAKGVIFVTLEDETANANIIIWADVFERFRRATLGARLMGISGEVQRAGPVIHLLADEVHDLTPLLGRLDLPTDALDASAMDEARNDPTPDAETPKSDLTQKNRARRLFASRDFH